MIDHITLRVSDVEKSKAFYQAVFQSLGYSHAFGQSAVFHAFDVGQGLFEIMQAENSAVATTTHVALRVSDKDGVEAFYEAALEAGGRDNGVPGPRPEYTGTYYACFVLDPDGHNIEVMLD
jgi:catechol 2,3-dioxygenase-like lactoylglutathione lyase family enzyme